MYFFKIIKPTWMLSLSKNYKTLSSIYLIFFFFIKTDRLDPLNPNYILKLKFFFYLNAKGSTGLTDHSKNVNFFLNDLNDSTRDTLFFKQKKLNNQIIYPNSLDNVALKKKFYHQLLSFFFLNSFFEKKNLFNTTGFFKMFFFKNSKGSPYILNLNKVLMRWVDFFNLMLNLFYYQVHTLSFSSPFLKKETLSLN